MYKRGKDSFYKDPKATALVEEVQWLMKSQYRGKPLDKPGICVSINFSFKNKASDVDGLIKSLLDCGNHILWTDDNLINELHVFKFSARGKDSVDMAIDHQEDDAGR